MNGNSNETKIAQVKSNGDIFILSPLYNTYIIDSLDFSNVHPFTISDTELGRQLKLSLDSSLLDWSQEANRVKSTERYKEWREKIIAKYKYKNRRAFFINMNLCTVFEKGNGLLFSPNRHTQLEGWGRVKSDVQNEITIPAASTSEVIGSTLRIALERASEM